MQTKSRGGAARRPKPAAAGRTGGAAKDVEPTAVLLRIPTKVLTRVDRLVAARRAENPIARTTWLLEAVNEKVKREEREREEKDDDE